MKLEPWQIVQMMMQDNSGSRRATDEELSQLDFGFYNEKYNFDGWDSDAQPPEPKCRHNWVPTLLLNHTVYDCKHCKAKKELVDTIKI